jgi:hypothetical protein
MLAQKGVRFALDTLIGVLPLLGRTWFQSQGIKLLEAYMHWG